VRLRNVVDDELRVVKGHSVAGMVLHVSSVLLIPVKINKRCKKLSFSIVFYSMHIGTIKSKLVRVQPVPASKL
jgi:hypothetical protein